MDIKEKFPSKINYVIKLISTNEKGIYRAINKGLDFLKEEIQSGLDNFFPNINVINLDILKNEDNNEISVSMDYKIQNTGINDSLNLDFE